MNIIYIVGGLIGVGAVLDGIWLIASLQPLVRTHARMNRSRTPTAKRWMGVGEIVGGAGVAVGVGVYLVDGPIPAAFIFMVGIAGMYVSYAAAWSVDYRARRRVSH